MTLYTLFSPGSLMYKAHFFPVQFAFIEGKELQECLDAF